MENQLPTSADSIENEESDSGDSLFITQKPIPHPVRAPISPHSTLRSTPVSPRLFESGSSSESEPEYVTKKEKKLPKYKFPFLKRKSLLLEDGSLSSSRNRAIHHNSMAGFFKCVDKMWPHGHRRKGFESTLPTVDLDNEEITPITEDETSDEEAVKIVGKRLFVYSLNPTVTKTSQPWFKSLKNKIPQSNQANKATPQEHNRTKHKSQSTSSKSKDLSNKQQKHIYSSDSDATTIGDYELPTSISKSTNKATKDTYVPQSTVTSTAIQPSVNRENELSALEESDNIESQSILQNNALDIRGSGQDSVCNERDRHQNTRKKRKSKKMDRRTELMSVSCNAERDQTGPSIHEDTGQPSCPNDDTTVKKKKKKHNMRNGDQENTEKGTDSLNLDALDSITAVEKNASDVTDGKRKKHKKKQKADLGGCNDEHDVALKKLQLNSTDKNILSKIVESRGKSELVDNSASDCIATQSDDSVSVKRKKRKVSSFVETVENANFPLSQSTWSHGEDKLGISTKDNGSTQISSHKNKTSRKLHEHFKTKNNESVEELDCECGLESTVVTEPMSLSSNTERDVTGQSIHEDTGQPSGPNVETFINNVRKKKKKHKKKIADLENADNGTIGLNLYPLQMLNDGHADSFTAEDKEMSDMSDGRRKKFKKKRKADPEDCTDEHPALKKLHLNKTAKNEKSGLVKHHSSASDCIVTQTDESVSVRRIKSASETVEKANLPLSPSTQSHGADELGISTNEVESAETNGLLQEPVFSNKTKKKKKRRKDDQLGDFGTNGEASEGADGSKDCDRTEVVWSHSGDGDHVKKKKKSKHKSHEPDIVMTTQRQTSEVVKDAAILSPNASSERKKKHSENSESVSVESAVETNVKRKKLKKNRLKDVEIISIPSQDEMLTSSGRLEKSSRTKAKKRLYNLTSETLWEGL